MSALLAKIASDVPNLAALIVVVGLFLRYTAKRDEAFKTMNDENNEARRHSREIIEKCTATMATVPTAINEMARTMEELRIKCRRDA